MSPGGQRILVLVTGAARSGTSTAAGSLHHLGLDVPGPYLGMNESNPKGFYESHWSVRFHNRLIQKAGINVVDGRPEALERIRAVVDDRARKQLADYFVKQQAFDQLVVKDPRTVWTQDLWAAVAQESGRQPRYLSMVRHPAEVVSSRGTYYGRHARAAGAVEPQQQATLNLMRWVNTTLVSERGTRGAVRSFVSYADLLDDWRPTLARVGSELGLHYDPPVELSPHPVDGFIDPDLRRHGDSWADVPVAAALREVAQAVWDNHELLVAGAGADPVAEASLDRLAEDYRRLVDEAHLLAQEALHDAGRRGRAAGVAEGRRLAAEAVVEPRLTGGARSVDDVRSRELVRIVARRFLGGGRP